jgi:hypothetical protein
MDLDELVSKAREIHALLDDRKSKTDEMIKETGVWIRRLGQALQAAKDKLKITGGGWQKWLSEVAQIPGTTAREAIRVFKGTKSEDAVRGLPVTKVKVRLGISKPKPKTLATKIISAARSVEKVSVVVESIGEVPREELVKLRGEFDSLADALARLRLTARVIEARLDQQKLAESVGGECSIEDEITVDYIIFQEENQSETIAVLAELYSTSRDEITKALFDE